MSTNPSYAPHLDSQRPVLLILESHWSGHLLVYVGVLIDHALRNNYDVVVGLGRGVRESKEYQTHLAHRSQLVTIVEVEASLTPTVVAQASKRFGAAFTIVPHGDVIATKLALTARYRGQGRLIMLVMRDPRWERPLHATRALRNVLKLMLLRRAQRMLSIDLVWLREPRYSGSSVEKFAIDPFVGSTSWEEISEESNQLRASLSLDSGVFWFFVTGAISARKNVPLVLDALEKLRAAHPSLRVGFCLVGPIQEGAGITEEWVRARCSIMSVRCVVKSQILTNSEMNAAIAAADAVVMAYSTHSPNSTLGKAYVLGTRLVAAGPPSIRKFVRSLDFGLESALRPDLLAQNMYLATQSDKPRTHHGELTIEAFASALIPGRRQ